MHRCLPTPTRTEAENLSYKVFVGGIDETITQEVLREALMPFGQVRNVNIIRLPDGRLKGFAFVQFMEQGPVDMLIQRQNLMVNGRRLYFGSATAKKSNPNQQYVMYFTRFLLLGLLSLVIIHMAMAMAMAMATATDTVIKFILIL